MKNNSYGLCHAAMNSYGAITTHIFEKMARQNILSELFYEEGMRGDNTGVNQWYPLTCSGVKMFILF